MKDKGKVMIEEVISNDYDVSGTFNKFFANVVQNLKIIPSENLEPTIQCETENPVQNATSKFKIHLGIKMIIFKINPNKIFSFCPAPHNEVLKQI